MRIAQRTGCQFVGVDINPVYVAECTELAKSEGVAAQGEFLISSILDLAPAVKKRKYTHVLVLGAMLNVHADLDKFLSQLLGCCNKNTRCYSRINVHFL